MHIPDGFLNPKYSSGLLGLALGVLGYCFGKVMKAVTAVVPQRVMAAAGNALGNIQMGGKRVLTQMGEGKIHTMGVVAAWVFSAQMFNFPINSGTSGHLIGGVFASVLLGPFAGTIVIAVVLLIQSLLFADGGIMALGANIINMAVLGSLVSYYIFSGLKRIVPETLAIVFTSWLSVMMAAFACSLEIGLSGTISLPSVTTAMMRVHSIIGVAEALITLLLLKIYRKSDQS